MSNNNRTQSLKNKRSLGNVTLPTDFDLLFRPFSPHWVGLDTMLNHLTHSPNTLSQEKYPPHNIERINEYEYEITLAVAGFSKDEISVTTQKNHQNPNVDDLIIEGKKQKDVNETEREYIYKGIALRDFKKVLQITKPLKIMEASIDSGLLVIKIGTENAEDYKPKEIPIN